MHTWKERKSENLTLQLRISFSSAHLSFLGLEKMGLLSHRISRDDLKPGDHIYSWRNAYIYSHHGIYVGYGEVIHFTRGGGLETGTGTFLDEIIVSSVPRHGGDNPCPRCGDQSKLDGVISSCLDCFLSGGNLYRFEYSASKAIFIAKQRGGICTIAPSDLPDEVISRAKYLLSRKNGFGAYHVLNNNCEDFAIYCKTGLVVLSKLGSSGQANAVSAAWDVFSWSFAGVAKTVSVGSAANYVISSTLGVVGVTTGFGVVAALAGFGKYCIGRLNYDIGVRKDVRKVPVEELVVIIAIMEGNKKSS